MEYLVWLAIGVAMIAWRKPLAPRLITFPSSILFVTRCDVRTAERVLVLLGAFFVAGGAFGLGILALGQWLKLDG